MAEKQRPLNANELAAMARIEDALARKDMSWAALARACNRSTQLGAQWSGRRSFPPQRVLQQIAEVLEVSRAWLLSGDEDDAEVKARTVRQARVLKLMLSMSPEQEAAILAAAEGIATHMDKKKS
jgi:transcriptional regulator with XRE-family HTH domain